MESSLNHNPASLDILLPQPDHLPSYTVKYLGVVEGSMGVLSRKMALPNYPFKAPPSYYVVDRKYIKRKIKS
jgi:hypothetical protein